MESLPAIINSPYKYLRHAWLYLDAQCTMGFIRNKTARAGAIFPREDASHDASHLGVVT
jgi:hypothetical protein